MDLVELNYERVAKELLQEAASSRAAAFSRLPSERDLARKYNCSRVTIRKALERLKADGCVSTVKGQGNFWLELKNEPKKADRAENLHVAIVVFNFGIADSFMCFLNGVQHAAEENCRCQYSIYHLDATLGDTPGKYTALEKADGYLVTGDFRLSDLSWFINTRKPMVVLGQASDQSMLTLPNRPFSLVRQDSLTGWSLAAAQLLARGCRRPAVFVASNHQGYRERFQGVQLALRNAGLPEENGRLVVADTMVSTNGIPALQLFDAFDRLWQEAPDFDCLLTTVEPWMVVMAAQRRGIAREQLFPVISECLYPDFGAQIFEIDTLSYDQYVLGMQCSKCLGDLFDGRTGYTVVNVCPLFIDGRARSAAVTDPCHNH